MYVPRKNFKKIIRYLKIHYICNSSGNMVPSFRASGRWLKEIGFEIGDMVTVKVGEGFMVVQSEKEDMKEFITCKNHLKTVKKRLEELSIGLKKNIKR